MVFWITSAQDISTVSVHLTKLFEAETALHVRVAAVTTKVALGRVPGTSVFANELWRSHGRACNNDSE
jgi:hypothetical protein